MTPFVQDTDLTVYVGDALDVLRTLPDGSVDCCVTSPPYWGLRDYGVDGQLGLEATPDEYVAAIVAVFREVRRVLAADGTCWVNLGDTYNANTGCGFDTNQDGDKNGKKAGAALSQRIAWGKPKDLVGVPWRVAFALQADGWYLRSDIIWAKPNPMPESVTDRPTKAHEYVFLLSKSPRYWFDAEAVREPFSGGTHSRGSTKPRELPKTAEPGQGIKNNTSMSAAIWAQAARPVPQIETLDGSDGEAPRGPDGRRNTHVEAGDNSLQHRNGDRWPGTARNIRSVWEIATQPYPEAHFATFPEELARRCILAGCPEWVCGTCGKPRERIVERELHPVQRTFTSRAPDDGYVKKPTGHVPAKQTTETLGWSDCGHGNYRPGTVLDPFLGSGTTALVARKHGRRCVGIELNPRYARLAAERCQQLSLLAEALT